jgi:hypothetical protein
MSMDMNQAAHIAAGATSWDPDVLMTLPEVSSQAVFCAVDVSSAARVAGVAEQEEGGVPPELPVALVDQDKDTWAPEADIRMIHQDCCCCCPSVWKQEQGAGTGR